MKKIYIEPAMEVIYMQTTVILAGSFDGGTDRDLNIPLDLGEIDEEGFAD